VEQIMEHHAALFSAASHDVTILAGGELRDAAFASRLAAHDIVFAHNLLTMPFQPDVTAALWRIAEEQPQVRFIAWVHDVAAANPAYADAAQGVLRRCSPNFEYIAVSERRRRELHETMHVPLERCRVIPNGIDPLDHWRVSPAWRPFIENAHLLERDLILLHPARLVPRKNIELSLQVLAALRANGRDAALLVTAPADVHRADASNYENELRDVRQRLDLEEHAFFLTDHAPVSQDDLAAFYQMADAVFFPSTQEGFGLPVLEAALHRVPLFCARIEPLDALLPGNATYFELRVAPEEIASLIMRRLGASPAIQARQEAVRQYAWPAVYRNYIAPLLGGRPD
jgi:glycosyltransferase involved in cell wall biosynthesis